MSTVLVTKLLAGPLVIAAASLAGKRWGPTVAGLIGGLPLIASCVIATLWLAYGQDYALHTAATAPAGLWANAVYMLTLGYSSRYFGWAGMLACGWLAYLLSAWALAASGLANQQWVCFAALPALLLSVRLLPQPSGPAVGAHLPQIELLARMAVALVLVATLTTLSQRLGTALTGVMSGGPVVATVIPAFTQAKGERNTLLFQLRGFLVGLVGFGLSFILLVPLASVMGPWAAIPAAIVAMLSSVLLTAISRRRAHQ